MNKNIHDHCKRVSNNLSSLNFEILGIEYTSLLSPIIVPVQLVKVQTNTVSALNSASASWLELYE